MSQNQVTIIIPARYSSTRLPGKPLADINGKPMIQWVYERCKECENVSDVIVATDNELIKSVVASFGGRAVMSRPDHESGTDRLAEVAASLDSDIIVNVQGDEPTIEPSAISTCISPMLQDKNIDMATLMCPINSKDELNDPNVVKVVTSKAGFALYFSRAPIPLNRESDSIDGVKKHIGLYAYRREFLLKLAKMPMTTLELTEKLEQLRVLEHGFNIYVSEVQHNAVGVDTEKDLDVVRKLLR